MSRNREQHFIFDQLRERDFVARRYRHNYTQSKAGGDPHQSGEGDVQRNCEILKWLFEGRHWSFGRLGP